jgi:hypothetical protein
MNRPVAFLAALFVSAICVSSACMAADPRPVRLAPSSESGGIVQLKSLTVTSGFVRSIALHQLMSRLSA